MPKASPIALTFAAALDEKFHAPDYPHAKFNGDYAVLAGQKYDKIIIEQPNGGRSVHAFIERSTGALIKAGGWAAPQKNSDGTLAVRYDLSDPVGLANAIEQADPHGGYLYKR